MKLRKCKRITINRVIQSVLLHMHFLSTCIVEVPARKHGMSRCSIHLLHKKRYSSIQISINLRRRLSRAPERFFLFPSAHESVDGLSPSRMKLAFNIEECKINYQFKGAQVE